jgi:hypothetical protein
METKPNTDHKQFKGIDFHKFWLYIALTFVLTGPIGVICGYFLAINIHGEARAAVYSDIQLVSKEVK